MADRGLLFCGFDFDAADASSKLKSIVRSTIETADSPRVLIGWPSCLLAIRRAADEQETLLRISGNRTENFWVQACDEDEDEAKKERRGAGCVLAATAGFQRVYIVVREDNDVFLRILSSSSSSSLFLDHRPRIKLPSYLTDDVVRRLEIHVTDDERLFANWTRIEDVTGKDAQNDKSDADSNTKVIEKNGNNRETQNVEIDDSFRERERPNRKDNHDPTLDDYGNRSEPKTGTDNERKTGSGDKDRTAGKREKKRRSNDRRDGRGFVAMMDLGAVSPTLLPVDVQLGVAQVACGKNHALFLTDRGEVLALGSNSRRQLGLADVFQVSSTPAMLEALEGVVVSQVAAGGWHSMALTIDGDVYLWGWNECGQCGRPFEPSGAAGVAGLDAGKRMTVLEESKLVANEEEKREKCEVETKGIDEGTKISIFADPDFSDLADSDPVSQTLPFPFPFPFPVRRVAAGSRHSLFLGQSGAAFSCGANHWGQLGRQAEATGDWKPGRVEVEKVEDIWAGWWNSFFLID